MSFGRGIGPATASCSTAFDGLRERARPLLWGLFFFFSFAQGINELSSTALLVVCVCMCVWEREPHTGRADKSWPFCFTSDKPSHCLLCLGLSTRQLPTAPDGDPQWSSGILFFPNVSDLHWSRLQGEGTEWNREFIFILCHLVQRLLHNQESEIERIRLWSHFAHELGYNTFIHCKQSSTEEATVVPIIYSCQ